MKRTLLCILALVMCLALCACGDPQGGTSDDAENSTTTTPTTKHSTNIHNHEWKESTCTEPKTCMTCGATEGSANGHEWKESTCTEPKTCMTCGATEGNPKGHSPVIDPAVPATCVVAGKTEGSHCDMCKTVLTPQNPAPIDKNRHNFVCGYCVDCGHKQPDSVGLRYYSYGGGECAVIGIGSCTDKSVVIPEKNEMGETVVAIRSDAFAFCKQIESVRISDSVKMIYYDAFNYCVNMKEVYVGKGVNRILSSAFQGCTIEKVHISDIASWVSIDFDDQTAIPQCMGSGGVYLNGSLIVDLVIPEGVTKIGSAFLQYRFLKSVTLPDSLTEIGDYAFNGTAIEKLVIPDTVKKIGSYAFRNCYNLVSVVIPASVTSIRIGAFENCQKLTIYTFWDKDPFAPIMWRDGIQKIYWNNQWEYVDGIPTAKPV